METRIIDCHKVDSDQLQEAARALRGGAVVVLPTDTVYALAANACDRAACERIYRIKNRHEGKSLLIFVHCVGQAKKLVRWNSLADRLAQQFWPGPLTLVLEKLPGAQLAAGNGNTVGVRVPNHAALREWLFACDVPLAQTSANRSGEPPSRHATAVIKEFSGRVDYIFSCGELAGTESTIVDLSGKEPAILRAGAIARELLLSTLAG